MSAFRSRVISARRSVFIESSLRATVRSESIDALGVSYVVSLRTERTPGALPESFSYGAYRTFQVPVRRIAELSGLDLTSYIAADPLERLETTRLPRELVQHDHILL